MKSATSSRPGACALKLRLTRSGHLGLAGSGTVVRALRRRVLPRQPLARISRSTVHRATRRPWRFRCARAFTAPYSDSGFRRPSVPGSNIAASHRVTSASFSARRDGGLDLAAQYVLGATGT